MKIFKNARALESRERPAWWIPAGTPCECIKQIANEKPGCSVVITGALVRFHLEDSEGQWTEMRSLDNGDLQICDQTAVSATTPVIQNPTPVFLREKVASLRGTGRWIPAHSRALCVIGQQGKPGTTRVRFYLYDPVDHVRWQEEHDLPHYMVACSDTPASDVPTPAHHVRVQRGLLRADEPAAQPSFYARAIVVHQAICYLATSACVAIGITLFWPANLMYWLSFSTLLCIIELFVFALVASDRRLNGPRTGSMDTVRGHTAMAFAAAAFAWPSWQYCLVALGTILMLQFLPGPRSRCVAVAFAMYAVAVVGWVPHPSLHWAPTAIAGGLVLVLISTGLFIGTAPKSEVR